MVDRRSEKTFPEIGVKAARAGGKILLDFFEKELRIDYKGEKNLVTDADRGAEAIIVETIRSSFPDHRFLGEEGGSYSGSGETTSAESIYKWIIDPLDGTTNFAHTFPMFCVSIALERSGEIVFGVVLDPVRDEIFLAETGQGATLNGRPIRVSKTEQLNDSLLVTGFAYDIRRNLEHNLDHFTNFSIRAQGIRRTGTAALDLCYVAMGRLDGFWEMKLSPWDTAAGALICGEAGGRVTTFKGAPASIYLKEILATNGKIHSEMIDVLALPKRTPR